MHATTEIDVYMQFHQITNDEQRRDRPRNTMEALILKGPRLEEIAQQNRKVDI